MADPSPSSPSPSSATTSSATSTELNMARTELHTALLDVISDINSSRLSGSTLPVAVRAVQLARAVATLPSPLLTLPEPEFVARVFAAALDPSIHVDLAASVMEGAGNQSTNTRWPAPSVEVTTTRFLTLMYDAETLAGLQLTLSTRNPTTPTTTAGAPAGRLWPTCQCAWARLWDQSGPMPIPRPTVNVAAVVALLEELHIDAFVRAVREAQVIGSGS